MRLRSESRIIKIQTEFLIKNEYLAHKGCMGCIQKPHCQAHRLVEDFMVDFDDQNIIKSTYHAGQEIFSHSDEHDGLYIVKSGMFESYAMNSEGELQVLGFHMAGDLFGAENNNNNHNFYVKALDTGSVCKIPFFVLEEYANKNPKLTTALIKLLGEIISKKHDDMFLLNRMNAKRRIANFILDLRNRMTNSGFDDDSLRLHMSRVEIANYLGLSVETVSRIFTRFQDKNVLAVDRRIIKIIDLGVLYKIAQSNEDTNLILDKMVC